MKEFTSVKEAADEAYIYNLYFNYLRLFEHCGTIGLNVSFFAYCFAFRHLKLYLSLSLVIATALATRNIVSRYAFERIYYPLEPIY